MLPVALMRDVFKVASMGVRFVAVDMVDLAAGGTRAEKRMGDKAVDAVVLLFPTRPKRDVRIASALVEHRTQQSTTVPYMPAIRNLIARIGINDAP